MRTVVFYTLLAASLLPGTALAGPTGPNLITNGTFAAPTVSGGPLTVTGSTELGSFSFNGSTYNSSLQGWSVNGTNPYTLWYVASTATTETAFSRYDSSSASAPGYTGRELFRATPGADGANPNFVAMDGDPGVQGGINQMLTGLTIGTVYELTFDFAAAQLVTGNGSYTSQLFYNLGTSATINTGTAASVRANGGNSIAQGGTAPWTTQTAYFEATSATEFLSFLSLGGSGEPPMALLDNVSLYAAPEPSSLALLGTGIAFGLIRRRRHLARAAVTRE